MTTSKTKTTAKSKSKKPKQSLAVPFKANKKPLVKTLGRHDFGIAYVVLATIILLSTTVLWAVLGARLNRLNADQLVDPYLFSSWTTFHGATFPGAHTFLIKWPLFALINVFGISPQTLTVFTVLVVLLTIGSLAWLMYRVERRPLVIGTLFLALASCMILVPAQPYAGGILPVNMAMLTTRNIEYILFLVSTLLLARSAGLKTRKFYFAVGLLGLLIASDKLFLSLSLGGSLMALAVYALAQRWRLVTLCARWLFASLAAGVLATLILVAINASGLTHIADQSGASPYGLVQNAKDGALALSYALLGLFTNFGANPAFDATELRHLPSLAFHRIFNVAGAAYIVNAAAVMAGVYVTARFALASLRKKKPKLVIADDYFVLSLMLFWSTNASFAVFVVSTHYYAVDARYLTIAVFAVFLSIAAASRKYKWQPERLVVTGLVLLVSILAGVAGTLGTHHRSQSAMQPISDRNVTVGQVLSRHRVDALVGDYWRVLPIKFAAPHHGQRVNVAPLSDCTTLRHGLSSTAWNPDLHKHSFAYLISLDKSLTDFPHCTLKQVIAAYGSPNTTVLIAGNVSAPQELLLFYDRGIRPPDPSHAPEVISTIKPIQIDQMENTRCVGPTILSIVAHQDDDLLFMNPDLLHDIGAGHCVRTVYLTAGDGGHGKFYWLSREQGSEAAYDAMIGATKGWLQQTVQLPGGQYVTVASPIANSKISLLFLHLPDGNLTGHGFSGSHYESLEGLLNGGTTRAHSIDDQSSYDSGELIEALKSIMQVYQPAQIRTQATASSAAFPDHSDHMAASRFAQAAYERYEQAQYDNLVEIPFARYIGYPVRDLAPNVSGDDLARKQAAFFAYARFDGAVCYSMRDCSHTATYREYLEREYTEQ